MAESYATLDEYRSLTGDTSTADDRVTSMLEQQSAKLRAECSISAHDVLTADQATLARGLVCDAVRKALSSSNVPWLERSMDGVETSSFSANGFQLSVDLANASGAAWFDTSMLKALKRSLGSAQRMGWL